MLDGNTLGIADPTFADIVNEKCEEIHDEAKAKGWWEEDRNLGECIALMHSELSEALEADRTDMRDNHLPERMGLEVELADCVIRIFDLAGAYNMDLGGAIEEKIAYNRNRPFKHGKKY